MKIRFLPANLKDSGFVMYTMTSNTLYVDPAMSLVEIRKVATGVLDHIGYPLSEKEIEKLFGQFLDGVQDVDGAAPPADQEAADQGA